MFSRDVCLPSARGHVRPINRLRWFNGGFPCSHTLVKGGFGVHSSARSHCSVGHTAESILSSPLLSRACQVMPPTTTSSSTSTGARTSTGTTTRAVATAEEQPPKDSDIEDVGWASDGTASTDTEADADAAPAGSGPRGIGPTLTVYRGRKRRPLQDGGGLCSPGRWAPSQRPTCRHPRLVCVRAAIRRELQSWKQQGGADFDGLLKELCKPEHAEDPFPENRTARLLQYLRELYGTAAEPRPGDRVLPIRVRLLQCLLRDASDPDHQGLDTIAAGVPIGVGVRMPRTPAVYGPRRKWAIKGQEDPGAWMEPWRATEWQDNYQSARDEADEIERQLDELANESPPRALKLQESELRARWPDAAVASLGALVKKAADGSKQVRILYDGTHGANVNPRIRLRDKERGPTTADVKAQLRAQSRSSRPTLGIAVDVQSAHRIIPVREADWRYQVCRARPGGPLYAFCCGVFGISSASYWWGRLASALVRTVHHVADRDHELWILLVADDIKLESTAAAAAECIFFALWVLVLLGVPLRWAKTAGGLQLAWVGYWFDYPSHGLGLSESRAAWAVAWCRRQAVAGGGRLAELREGVGRLGFVVGALTYEAPFLAPLYSYLALLPDGGFHLYPAFVRLTLNYLADAIQGCRTYSCRYRPPPDDGGPRVDAMADDSRVGIGGWLPTRGSTGEVETAASPWFSVWLSRETAPWAFTKGGKPQRTIAALEAFGTLLAIRCFEPWLATGGSGTMALRSYTDNQGNATALNRLTTTTFPLNCVVMELAATLKRMRFSLDLRWLPRELNAEADALSNGLTLGFSPSKRIDVDIGNMRWLVLDDVMSLGLSFHAENIRKRQERRGKFFQTNKRRKGQRLRDREPW